MCLCQDLFFSAHFVDLLLLMAAPQEPAFQRTPLPSAPASSPITKLQIALNNLIGQLCVRH